MTGNDEQSPRLLVLLRAFCEQGNGWIGKLEERRSCTSGSTSQQNLMKAAF